MLLELAQEKKVLPELAQETKKLLPELILETKKVQLEIFRLAQLSNKLSSTQQT